MTLRARLAVALAIIAAAGIAAASVAAFAVTRSELAQETDDFLVQRSREIAEGRRAEPRGGRRDGGNGLEATVDQLSFDPDAVVQIVDRTGDVAGSTGVELPVTAADRTIANAPDETLSLRDVTIDGVDYRMITRRVGGGAVQVARDLTENAEVLDGLRNRLIVIGVVASLLAAAIGWWFTRRTTRPLRDLSESAEQIARTEDLNVSIPVEHDDEVGRLAQSFDKMLGALAQSREQQRRLVQDAGHELRTPLTSLQTNVELLQRVPTLDPEQLEQALTSIHAEVAELGLLSAELIELATESRDDEAAAEDLDLADVVEGAVARFRRRHDRPVVVGTESAKVRGHATLLDRAVGNLLSNANKFSPPGESITVRQRGGEVDVLDQGPGIPPQDRQRVFDRFYRSDATRTMPGSGLGLAIVQQIVARHGGEVWAREAPGGGGDVGFRIPLAGG